MGVAIVKSFLLPHDRVWTNSCFALTFLLISVLPQLQSSFTFAEQNHVLFLAEFHFLLRFVATSTESKFVWRLAEQ